MSAPLSEFQKAVAAQIEQDLAIKERAERPSRRSRRANGEAPFDDAPPVNGPEDYDRGGDGGAAGDRADARKPPPIQWLDMSSWDHEPVPQREWAIRDRVPLNQAGLFSGEGGTGKSIIELMKNVAHVTGKDWLGSMPELGPALYLGAEDDKNELHIRLAAILKHYGVTFKEVIEGGLHMLSLLGQDATLCAASGKSGRVEVTGLYRQLYEAAGDIKPKNISIDTLSRAFAGNEIDRVQVYAFANHMQALAMAAGGSVTVLSHPSLSGIASGSGIPGRPPGTVPSGSGSTSPAPSPTGASSRTTTSASSSSRKISTVRPPRPSSCAISAAFSCPKAASQASTSWRPSSAPMRRF